MASISLNDIAPRRTYLGAEHSFIAGLNGTGKTVLLKTLIDRHNYAVVHDAKGTLRWPGWIRLTRLNDVIRSTSPKVIYAPDRRELRDKIAQATFFEWNYERARLTNEQQIPGGPFCELALGVDEVYSIVDRQELPEPYWACLTRGREFHLSVYSVSQRPRFIPNVIISEARNTYIFYLRLESDRSKLAAMIPIDEEQIADLPDHYFYYYREGSRELLGPCKLPDPRKRRAPAA